ncbi:pseudouridine synthase [Aerococcus sanguinicola]|uniref:Pseudouridine synthase n=1 Tax=Aerococcus sanguinicola TaxID=119206 RepID=A0A0X8F9W4_9LACT|nr:MULTISPECIES: pseudouridine synthase [Aerococcus]AMB93449.1 pseudouridine synthase [Aerococcus sanguinicola]MDK7051019.1 pseudouridine synthase [Aerococcus sanguinicola]OFT94470.1 pseudouridine synthase [Aerococcus sp. HMSC23C02]PKZ20494.1 rRNA pseudouridine synthase [Aerococcus sanguinicola]
MERLQKVIAHAGVASRRQAEKLITAGRVKVNGETVVELGTKVSRHDRVEVDEVPIYKEEPKYFVLNKPTGVISAVEDDRGRPCVTDYFPDVEERIYPIGRLDYNTSGLLLLTNDGEFANLLMHPSHEVAKGYIAKVNGIPNRDDLRRLEKGVIIDRKKTAPAKARMIKTEEAKDYAVVELVIHEGRNRQVRKMFDAIGHSVQKLRREFYGNIYLDDLRPGQSRVLLPFEVQQLKDLAEDGKEK